MIPELMGVLNVTPDSFSDGGQFLDVSKAVNRGIEMWEQGASWIDVGGESTRPGAEIVSESDEVNRVLPVVLALVSEGVKVSIDTQKPAVAALALEAGATMVNDVGGLRLPAMREVVASSNCHVCIMHMKGDPKSMQSQAVYKNVVEEVKSFLLNQAKLAESDGIGHERIILDPGIGFGKTTLQNLELIRQTSEFVQTGYRVLVGASRKTFIGKVLGSELEPIPPADRLEGTLAVHLLAQLGGAQILRVHDVVEARRVSLMANAVLQS